MGDHPKWPGADVLIGGGCFARAGYDLQRAGRTFDVLAKLDDKAITSWKDTHPAAERIVAWREVVAEVEASPDQLPTKAIRECAHRLEGA